MISVQIHYRIVGKALRRQRLMSNINKTYKFIGLNLKFMRSWALWLSSLAGQSISCPLLSVSIDLDSLIIGLDSPNTNINNKDRNNDTEYYFDQTFFRASVICQRDERGVTVVRSLVVRGEHHIAIVVNDNLCWETIHLENKW